MIINFKTTKNKIKQHNLLPLPWTSCQHMHPSLYLFEVCGQTKLTMRRGLHAFSLMLQNNLNKF